MLKGLHLLGLAILLSEMALGCSRTVERTDPPGQWILESYSADGLIRALGHWQELNPPEFTLSFSITSN